MNVASGSVYGAQAAGFMNISSREVKGIQASGFMNIGKNIQGSFLLGWTGWISLQSKGLSRVFSNTIVQKHQFGRMALNHVKYHV